MACGTPRELPKASFAETVRVLAPGSYRVEVDVDGQPRRTLSVAVVAGRVVDLLVPVE